MPAHSLPTVTGRGVLGWVRWLGVNLWLLGCALTLGVFVVLALDGVIDFDGSEPAWISFAWMCIYLPFTWPLYMGVVVAISRLSRHPRRWAVALAPPVLVVIFPLALLFVGSDAGITVLLLAYVGYGAIVRIPVRPPASAATS